MKWAIGALAVTAMMIRSSRFVVSQVRKTEITKWQYGKNGAVSLTYDDGSVNQFRIAVPIMDSFGFPATFDILTGTITAQATARQVVLCSSRLQALLQRVAQPSQLLRHRRNSGRLG
jgi:hypothetical protein